MKIELNIDQNIKEETIAISVKQTSTKVNKIIQIATNLEIPDLKLYGKHDNKIYPLQLTSVLRFYSADKKVFAQIDNIEMLIDYRLYELEESLSENFIRISNTEIINFDYVENLEIDKGGLIKIIFKNKTETYSSRRYLKKIKERLGL
ncbi:LytTR family DNA-binding domain-containing protein (plasmid) [Paraclostridium ghonii]|uniref:LytTR family DNA-binding domain-containing protein n=1 Tax=Paraclostridium ghonii TaxID=29358 RepID=UPI00202CE9C9|nr:LytTR family DNA-binding domain-containing protein [Paeniclostridium ghonii]MCM0165100.1 LytTR family transcriptional regulator [Paeniclostridium ghonii]